MSEEARFVEEASWEEFELLLNRKERNMADIRRLAQSGGGAEADAAPAIRDRLERLAAQQEANRLAYAARLRELREEALETAEAQRRASAYAKNDLR